jgi:uncharacterized membrane protein
MTLKWIRARCDAERLAVGGLCLLFALSLGVHYGVSDQNVYLLSGLRMADPSFLANDWFAAETVQHHAAFTYLVYLLQAAGPLPWTSAALYLLLKALVALSAYVTLRALYDRPLLPFLLSLILLHLAIGTTRLLSHPFFVPWLLPAGAASALFLAGVAALSRADTRPSRCVLSGALFGLSGLLHGTFLFLTPLFLGGVWVALPRRFSAREKVAFLIPYLALTLPVAWTVLARFDIGESAVGRLDALLRLRAPHHYLPGTWGMKGFALFAQHATLGVIGLLARWPQTPRSPIVLAAAASLAGLFILVLFCTTALFIPQVALLEPFHFVALLSCWALLFFAGALAQGVDPAQGLSPGRRLRQRVLLGLGLFVAFETNRVVGVTLILLTVLCLVGARIRRPVLNARRLLFGGTLLFLSGLAAFCLPLSTAFFVPYRAESGPCKWAYSLTPPRALAVLMPSRAESDLYRWVRASTPRDALFVAPLDLERFRLGAGRGIVVDWKGFPYRVQDAEAWYRRVTAVSGAASPASKQEVLQGYLLLNAGRARALARAFGARYVVVRAGQHLGDLSELPRVYANDEYSVYRIEGSGGG